MTRVLISNTENAPWAGMPGEEPAVLDFEDEKAAQKAVEVMRMAANTVSVAVWYVPGEAEQAWQT